MKTIVTLKQNLMKSVLLIVIAASSVIASAQPLAETHMIKTEKNVSDPSVNINKLSSFTAILNTTKVDLKWSTEIEVNLSHVTIEKSTDGVNFKEAALVFAYGNTTSKSLYAFADNISKIKSGSVYYRLRIVEVNGTTQYSDTHSLTISK